MLAAWFCCEGKGLVSRNQLPRVFLGRGRCGSFLRLWYDGQRMKKGDRISYPQIHYLTQLLLNVMTDSIDPCHHNISYVDLLVLPRERGVTNRVPSSYLVVHWSIVVGIQHRLQSFHNNLVVQNPMCEQTCMHQQPKQKATTIFMGHQLRFQHLMEQVPDVSGGFPKHCF